MYNLDEINCIVLSLHNITLGIARNRSDTQQRILIIKSKIFVVSLKAILSLTLAQTRRTMNLATEFKPTIA